MSALVLVLVLLAALLHATWNALVKVGGDPLVRLALTAGVCGLCALPFLPFVPVPNRESWSCLLASVVLHFLYYLCLALGYRLGDLSQVYPIARGVAPPLVAIGGAVAAGEAMTPSEGTAICVIGAGIISLGFARGRGPGPLAAVLVALATGLTIAAYTIVDGVGGRRSGHVLGYVVWLFVIDAVPVSIVVLGARWGRIRRVLRAEWPIAAMAGCLAAVAYAVVIWAMSMTRLAHVSALRETSVFLAAWIGCRVLREPFGRYRLSAAAMVALGIVALGWSGGG